MNETAKSKPGTQVAVPAEPSSGDPHPCSDAPEAVAGKAGKATGTGSGNRLSATVDRCWFKVMAGSRPDEKGPVFAAINGQSVLIKRNHWVQLPTSYLPVFEDALSSEVVVSEDGKSSVVRDVPRFNYEVRSLAEGKPKETLLPRGF